jgi:hypothetical protein
MMNVPHCVINGAGSDGRRNRFSFWKGSPGRVLLMDPVVGRFVRLMRQCIDIGPPLTCGRRIMTINGSINAKSPAKIRKMLL